MQWLQEKRFQLDPWAVGWDFKWKNGGDDVEASHNSLEVIRGNTRAETQHYKDTEEGFEERKWMFKLSRS